jgi:REP element-mobilizing transposase RayT
MSRQKAMATAQSGKRNQSVLPFPNTWGGRRKGAGRKPQAGRGRMPHSIRPEHRRAEPVHVTLRSAFRPLRSQFVFPTIRIVLRESNRRWLGRFQVVHFSVQYDHLHLIVEASDRKALLGGVRGLSVRLARRVNQLVSRRGRLIADRWHGRALATPRAVRRVLVYVLGNFRKHERATTLDIDPFSSAPDFDGFVELDGKTFRNVAARIEPQPARDPPLPGSTDPREASPAASPGTWLLRSGWARDGKISIHEGPRSR